MDKEYDNLKKKLFSLGYTQDLKNSNIDLITKLLEDIIKVSQTYQKLKISKLNEKKKIKKNLREKLKFETQKIFNKENNILHRELIEIKNYVDKIELNFKFEKKNLENKIFDFEEILKLKDIYFENIIDEKNELKNKLKIFSKKKKKFKSNFLNEKENEKKNCDYFLKEFEKLKLKEKIIYDLKNEKKNWEKKVLFLKNENIKEKGRNENFENLIKLLEKENLRLKLNLSFLEENENEISKIEKLKKKFSEEINNFKIQYEILLNKYNKILYNNIKTETKNKNDYENENKKNFEIGNKNKEKILENNQKLIYEKNKLEEKKNKEIFDLKEILKKKEEEILKFLNKEKKNNLIFEKEKKKKEEEKNSLIFEKEKKFCENIKNLEKIIKIQNEIILELKKKQKNSDIIKKENSDLKIKLSSNEKKINEISNYFKNYSENFESITKKMENINQKNEDLNLENKLLLKIKNDLKIKLDTYSKKIFELKNLILKIKDSENLENENFELIDEKKKIIFLNNKIIEYENLILELKNLNNKFYNFSHQIFLENKNFRISFLKKKDFFNQLFFLFENIFEIFLLNDFEKSKEDFYLKKKEVENLKNEIAKISFNDTQDNEFIFLDLKKNIECLKNK